MNAMKTGSPDIQRVGYRPSGDYRLDLEVFSIEELRRRVDSARLRAPQRIEFYQLICVSEGACVHTVDFKPVRCEPGTLLMLRPAQAQQFDAETGWNGWILIFRPEFLLPLKTDGVLSDMKMTVDLEALPNALQLGEDEARVLASAIMQMHRDAALHASPDLHNLLRHQLYALLLRLKIFHGQQEARKGSTSATLTRFKRFQLLVERNFSKWHRVADYAKVIGCSEKSLNRAVSDTVGMTAKIFIASRINLEAKRLLAHTAMPVGLISDQIGFDEATNFVKFFKREVGCSPGDFRRRYAASLPGGTAERPQRRGRESTGSAGGVISA